MNTETVFLPPPRSPSVVDITEPIAIEWIDSQGRRDWIGRGPLPDNSQPASPIKSGTFPKGVK